MSVRARLLVTLCAVALLSACVAAAAVAGGPATGESPAGTSAAPKKGKAKGAKKGCKKGWRKQTVTKNGKKVKVCKKVQPKQPGGGEVGPPAGGGSGPASLFEAPGKQLVGEEAKPFLQKYLANSTFTDCVPGWPACGGFENRFSHGADGTFYKCLLRPTSGSDVKSVGEFGYQDARVEPDGAWVYKELVYWYGNYTLFEWSVSTTGVVKGASLNEGAGAPEGIGPLQYVGGVAKNCSY